MVAQPPSDPSSAAAAAAYPRWVMFEQWLKIQTEGDSKTLAAARTSTGHQIQVSLRLTEPPGVSRVCLHLPAGVDAKYSNSNVVAAHGDSVLIDVTVPQIRGRRVMITDHFVYSAGAAAADPPRPPSLSLLPPAPSHFGGPAGLVCRGDDMVVAAHLALVFDEQPAEPADTPAELMMMRRADLAVFRSGEWSVKRLQIRCRDGGDQVPQHFASYSSAIVPVGDGLLCWVDLGRRALILGDVFEETPTLRYLPLPSDNTLGDLSNRNVCATAGGDALKFVNVFPRCCCGGAAESSCERCCHAYIIETWTMRIAGNNDDDDDMEWVKDGIVDASELWALDAYKGLPCSPLNHPVVSTDEPELICFRLHEPPVDDYTRYRDYNSVDACGLMVNMRSKSLHSVSRYEHSRLPHGALIPSNVSNFFNSCYLSGRSEATTVTGQRQEDIERPSQRNPTALQPVASSADEPSVQASEIFDAFQEIPSYGLDHDEVKVYRILSRDNCRRFRSLLRLPKNLRKDWLLMEIKASED